MLTKLKDKLIRSVAKNFLLKWADGKKTEIMRVVQALNMVLLGLVWCCEYGPEFVASLPMGIGELIPGLKFCPAVDMLNDKWVELSVLLAHFGLEFGIQDAKAKKRLGETPGAK